MPVRTDPVAKATIGNAGTKQLAKDPTLDKNVEINSNQSTSTERTIQTKSNTFATLDINKKPPSIKNKDSVGLKVMGIVKGTITNFICWKIT